MNLKPLDDVGSMEDVVVDRLRLSKQFLEDAEDLLARRSYHSVANRTYYAIFKAISAVHAVHGTGYKSHREALAEFNRTYVNEGVFPKEYGKNIHKAAKLRHSSDYSDFAKVTESEAAEQVQFAAAFLQSVWRYCEQELQRSI